MNLPEKHDGGSAEFKMMIGSFEKWTIRKENPVKFKRECWTMMRKCERTVRKKH
jgi:hypothetical protein